MRRYLSGVEPRKKGKTKEELLVTKRKYDSEVHKREFQPSWLAQSSWLEYRPPQTCKKARLGDGGDASRSTEPSVNNTGERDAEVLRLQDSEIEPMCDTETKSTGSGQCSQNQIQDLEPTPAMFCTVCCEYEAAGSFVTGCRNFQVESLRAHDKSASHQSNEAKARAKKAAPGSSKAEQMIKQLKGKIKGI